MKQVVPTILALIWVVNIPMCFGGALFPDIPVRHLPSIKALPSRDGIIIETRTYPFSGDALTPKTSRCQIEVGIIDIADKTESIWELPLDVVQLNDRVYLNSGDRRASWIPKTGQLLLALHNSVNLINRDGTYTKAIVQLPGFLTSYEDTDSFSVTQDAQLIAYHLYTRDGKDRHYDPKDKLAENVGKLYTDVMYQKAGEALVSVAHDGFPHFPALSPDGTKIAFETNDEHDNSSHNLLISEVGGRVIFSSDVFHNIYGSTWTKFYIDEIRWNPIGNKIGFVVVEESGAPSKFSNPIIYTSPTHSIKHNLYTINADGSGLKKITIGDKGMEVNRFAWSPSGGQIAFRSSTGKKEICSFSVLYSMQTGHSPCIEGYHLFTSNIDGSDLKQISNEAEFGKGELFWIQ
jgi:hypothetical protein